MIVVSDTSPLNYLILIGQVEVLPMLFERIVAPPAVLSELSHRGAPKMVRNWARATPGWLEIVGPSSIEPNLPLGAGEAAAICVARELHADLILVDERRATTIAERSGFLTIGTLGVLEVAAERGFLELSQSISSLRRTTFRASEKLLDELLRRDANRRSNSSGEP